MEAAVTIVLTQTKPRQTINLHHWKRKGTQSTHNSPHHPRVGRGLDTHLLLISSSSKLCVSDSLKKIPAPTHDVRSTQEREPQSLLASTHQALTVWNMHNLSDDEAFYLVLRGCRGSDHTLSWICAEFVTAAGGLRGFKTQRCNNDNAQVFSCFKRRYHVRECFVTAYQLNTVSGVSF
jgi:hypothetical protein